MNTTRPSNESTAWMNPTPSNPRLYSHPEVNARLLELFPGESESYMQSIRHVLNTIAVKQHMRQLQAQSDIIEFKKKTDLYAWLPCEFYLRLLGGDRYKRTMQRLINGGLLKASSFANDYGYSPTYSFVNEAHLCGYKREQVTCQAVLNKIRHYNQWQFRKHPSIAQVVIPHIIENFHRIDLTRLMFYKLWRYRYFGPYLKKHPNHPLSLSEYMLHGRACWSMIEQWNDSCDDDKYQWFKVCAFGHRLHYPFTFMSSEIRAYILDRHGRRITFTEYDLANSQPTIFASMLVGMNPSLKKSVFVQEVSKCKIYEDLAFKLTDELDQLGVEVDRDIAKPELLHFMYCRVESSAQEKFIQWYDEVGLEAKRIKMQEYDAEGNYIALDKRHAQLPKIMQREESDMFKPIWVELIREGYVILPVHDAIYVAGIQSPERDKLLRRIHGILKESVSIRCRLKMKSVKRIKL